MLTREEALWFTRNVIQMKIELEKSYETDPTVLDRKTYRTICKIEPQARDIQFVIGRFPEAGVTIPIEVYTTPKERKLLRDLLIQTVIALGNPKDATPEVKERMDLLKTAIRKFR